jgi:hypothetical protein
MARSLVAETGYWPVILGEDGDLARHERSVMKAAASPAEIVAESERIDCQGLTTRILEELIEDAATEDGNPDGVVPHGPWPEQSRPLQGYSILHRYGRGAPPPLHIGLCPATKGWMVPGFLHYGGWNACPGPGEHVARMRYWEGIHGAELVVMTHDTVEMSVASPPNDRESAMELAQHQFAYCFDIIDQGTAGSLEGLAASLMESSVWSFWWD